MAGMAVSLHRCSFGGCLLGVRLAGVWQLPSTMYYIPYTLDHRLYTILGTLNRGVSSVPLL